VVVVVHIVRTVRSRALRIPRRARLLWWWKAKGVVGVAGYGGGGEPVAAVAAVAVVGALATVKEVAEVELDVDPVM
jgi:hypothetical protein